MQKRYQWSKNFTNGDRYNGEATGENVKDGHGEYLWAATGAVYKGAWVNDLPHGHGVMTVPGSSGAPGNPDASAGTSSSSSPLHTDGYTYEGYFELGKRSGAGTCRFNSGRVYTGEWRQDEMSGAGTLTGAPGGLDNFLEYRGPFLRGRRHGGGGVCHYVNGDTYTGDWLQGKRQGHGEWLLHGRSAGSPLSGGSPPPPLASSSSSGAAIPTPAPLPASALVSYMGAFMHDAPACSSGGEIKYADGSSYTGGVAGPEAHRSGNGELRLAGGDVYTGGFSANLRHGDGTLRCAADGASFEGAWKGDRLHGHVVFRRPSREGGGGRRPPALAVVAYTGPCTQGEYSGVGARLTFSDQSVYQGEVRSGQPSGTGVMESRRLGDRDGVPPEWLDGGRGLAPMLVRYEGAFFGGRPDGDGTGSFRFVPALSTGSPPPQFNAAAGASAAAAAAAIQSGARGLRVTYQRGGTFSGRWANGLPHGSGGRWGWEEGDAYEGPVADGGLPQGRGVYRSAQAVYDGEFSRGQPNGRGVYSHLLVKESYDGQWAAGLFSGRGEYRQHDRESRGGSPAVSYTGDWEEGRMAGEGTEERACAAPSLDGDPVFADCPTRYEGRFARGCYAGAGTLTVAGGDAPVARYEGGFTDGIRTGTGVLTLPDGTTVRGPFTDGSPHGPAVSAAFASGITYNGPYNKGLPCGTGELLYPNGDRYKGAVESAVESASVPAARRSSRGTNGGLAVPAEWVPHRHGEGVFTFIEGNVLACTWKHNVLHGQGTYTTSTGEVSTRSYVDGVVDTRMRPAGQNIFTAENELPNTLSEDALRKAQAAESKKPSTFLRKGEGGVAAAAAPVKTVSPKKQRTMTTGTNNRSILGVSAASASTASHRRAPGSVGGGSGGGRGTAAAPRQAADASRSPVRRASTSVSPRARGAPHGAEATPQSASHETSPCQGSSLHGPVRSRAEVQAAIARRVSARGGGRASESPPQTPARTGSRGSRPAATAEVALFSKRPSLVDAFQGGITRLNIANGTTESTGGGSSDAGSSVATTTGTGTGRPRGPLKGQLRALMDEACAIRSSKEDEVQLLTEELRVLNERIWQLRFSLSGREAAKGAAKASKDGQRLSVMKEERRGTVEKLHCLLMTDPDAF